MKLSSKQDLLNNHNPSNKQNQQGTANSHRVFTQVNYRQFRQHLADIATKNIKGKGYETAIYDRSGNIQAIVHAASIDMNGQCYPAEYYIRSQALPINNSNKWQQAVAA